MDSTSFYMVSGNHNNSVPVSLGTMFPNASRAFIEANSSGSLTSVIEPPAPAPGPVARRERMNKTEREFAMIHGCADTFECLVLKWGRDEKTGDQMRYTIDFLIRGEGKPRVIEVKGGFIRSRDLVRFKGCRAEWQWLFDFELHQKANGSWERIL